MLTWLSRIKPREQLAGTLALAIAADIGLYAYGVSQGYGFNATYLPWNLFLAALPLVFALRLAAVLGRKRWSDWEPLAWTLAWWLFLPNSFYMISDFIHLRDLGSSAILFAAVLFTSFICLGVFLGFGSLAVVHYQLRRRIGAAWSTGIVAFTLLSCSFAIYIGRDLRWNTWDVIFSPAGLLFDISDRLLRPQAYGEMFVTVLSFFVLLTSLYCVLWTTSRVLRHHGK